MDFEIYGSWDCGRDVEAEAEAAFTQEFRPEDEWVCVWIDERLPAILQPCFSVEAAGYGAAIQQGLGELRAAARTAGLPGRLAEVVAMTEEGEARWVERLTHTE